MNLTFKNAILAIVSTMIIGGALGYFTVHPFAYDNKNLAKQIESGLTKIKR